MWGEGGQQGSGHACVEARFLLVGPRGAAHPFINPACCRAALATCLGKGEEQERCLQRGGKRQGLPNPPPVAPTPTQYLFQVHQVWPLVLLGLQRVAHRAGVHRHLARAVVPAGTLACAQEAGAAACGLLRGAAPLAPAVLQLFREHELVCSCHDHRTADDHTAPALSSSTAQHGHSTA